MLETDVFVGCVAIGVGLVVVLAAVLNWHWYYQMKKARWVESVFGRNGARLFFAMLGLALIVLGGAIASGFSAGKLRPGEPDQDSRRRLRGMPSTMTRLSIDWTGV